jgi:hypothetical protein
MAGAAQWTPQPPQKLELAGSNPEKLGCDLNCTAIGRQYQCDQMIV